MNRCAANPPCGNTGACNGAGACQLAATTVSCGTASCTGSTYTPDLALQRHAAPARRPRRPAARPTCAAATACRPACTADTDCLAPFTCQGTAPQPSCALEAQRPGVHGRQPVHQRQLRRTASAAAAPACPTCQACNGTAPGTCTPLAAGTTAPAGQCAAAPPCGNTGKCNGAGGCQQGSTSTACGLAVSCTGTTFSRRRPARASGTCSQAARPELRHLRLQRQRRA